jgi:hypothetical protein
MNDFLRVYKAYIKVFNYLSPSEVEDFEDIVDIFVKMTRVLEKNNVIRKRGIKHYEVIKTGEII